MSSWPCPPHRACASLGGRLELLRDYFEGGTHLEEMRTDPTWAQVSQGCKALIRHMLCPRPAERPSAAEVLQTEWLRNASREPLEHIVAGFAKLKLSGLQQLCLRVVQDFLIDETRSIDAMFAELDRSGDGYISYEELHTWSAQKQTAGARKRSAKARAATAVDPAKNVDLAFSRLDLAGDGRVDLAEFRIAVRAARRAAPSSVPGVPTTLAALSPCLYRGALPSELPNFARTSHLCPSLLTVPLVRVAPGASAEEGRPQRRAAPSLRLH